MSFQPVLPTSGYSGWLFLQRTADAQLDAFKDSPVLSRATETFSEKIGSVITAEELVSDRALLEVALGAYGLDDDINNTFFIRKILEDGTSDPGALANRLADSRYQAFSAAFGFGEIGLPKTLQPGFGQEITERYEAKQFQAAIGEQDNDMRLVMNLGPGLNDVVSGAGSDTAHWFGMMGNTPLRTVFETALGFPPSFGSLDIDQQLEQFRERAQSTFGTDRMADLTSAENQETLVRLYLIRSEANAFSQSSGANVALTLLRQI